MSAPAFMSLTPTGAGTGPLGLGPLGEAPLGGTDAAPYVLPVAQPGSDRMDVSERNVYADIIHERDGLVIGVLSRGSRRKWRQVWQAISREDAQALLAFAAQRRFWLLPTGDPAASRIVIYWLNADVAAQTLRAGYRSLEAEFIELTGPAASVS